LKKYYVKKNPEETKMKLWSKEEKHKLNEGIRLYGRNWDQLE
jgi:hypothetical protein